MQIITKWILLLILFSPALYCAAKQKKWYLYLLFAFLGILPEQFSISLHDKLPLLTASRVLIVITAIFWLIQRIRERNFKIPISLLVFFCINLGISVFHLLSDADEINRIFLLIAERTLVVLMIVDMIASREEFDRCVDCMILGCCAAAVIGICQTVFDYDISEVLRWRETVTSAMTDNRMGVVRAYATKSAIPYGCYCAFMVLPIYYRLQSTGKQRYSVAFALNFVALIATFTRSAWLCIAGIGALVFITRPVKMIRSLWPSLLLILALCLGFSVIQPKFGAALTETAKSSWNTVIQALPDKWFAQEEVAETTQATEATEATQTTETTEVTQTTEATEATQTAETTEPVATTPRPTKPQRPTFVLSEDFGLNANNPSYSRLFQWSALKYMMENGTFLLGNGYNAFRQGQIYFVHKNWGSEYMVAPVLDVGGVSIFAESGLIGMLSYLGLLGYMLLQSLRRRERNGAFDFYKLMIFTVPLYLLLNILSAFTNVTLVWQVFGLFYAYENLDKQGLLGQTPAIAEKKWQF